MNALVAKRLVRPCRPLPAMAAALAVLASLVWSSATMGQSGIPKVAPKGRGGPKQQMGPTQQPKQGSPTQTPKTQQSSQTPQQNPGVEFRDRNQIDRDTQLGFSVQPDQGGLRVTDLAADKFAEAAGLANGDIIQSVNSRQVRTQRELLDALRSGMQQPGAIPIGILRNGQRTTINFSGFGLRFGLGLAASDGAVRVSNVQAGSLAGRSGLLKGDELVSVNGKPVSSAEEAEKLVSQAGRGAELQIRRNGQLETIRLQSGGGRGDAKSSSLGSTLGRTLGRLNDLRSQLGDLAEELGPVGKGLLSLLDGVISDLGGLDVNSPTNAQKLIADARKALRSLQRRLEDLASAGGAGSSGGGGSSGGANGGGGGLAGMSRAVMGAQTDLDSLEAAALRQARDPRAGAPKGNFAEVRDIIARLHADLLELARRHAGPTRAAIEKIDARVASLAESLGRVAMKGEEVAPDLQELRKPVFAIRGDLEALKLSLAAEDRPPVDVLLGLVARIEDHVGHTSTK